MSIVKAHTSLIGDTGYNNHSKNFFKELSKLCQLQVRNFTVGKTWKGYDNDEPHNNEPYVDDTLKYILTEQTLNEPDGSRKEYPLYSAYKNEGTPDVHIVLNETDHYYFYDNYNGKKIAYNVWETTKQPENFFNKLKEFDQIWVPSKWQRDCTIEQGIPSYKVKIVPEGVDVEKYKPIKKTKKINENNPFKFVLIGRWDYRKATQEIIKAFTETFSEEENVQLILSVDNPFASDGFSTTEERLKNCNISHKNIKIVNFKSSESYIDMLHDADVFLSCARGEGWNLPLIEAMACGIPSIYSNWGGQLEFAEGRGIPVDIIKEVPVSSPDDNKYYSWTWNAPGNFAEPNFSDLSKKMRNVFENYDFYKQRALKESDDIRRIYTWKNAADIGKKYIDELLGVNEKESESIAIVMAHANTSERKKILKTCLESIKIPKILSSNFPVDSDAQELCDWLIYSKENPLLLNSEFQKYNVDYYYWYIDSNGNRVTKSFDYEHGYAVYCLIQKGIELAKLLNKKIVHLINYDYIISPKTLIDHENYLKEYDMIFYRQNWEDQSKAYCTGFFSAKTDSLHSFFNKYKSKSEYYTSMEGFNLIETNISQHYENTDFKKLVFTEDDMHKNNKINLEDALNYSKNQMKNRVFINFIDGPYVEVTGGDSNEYKVEFIDSKNNDTLYTTTIKNNEWARPNRKWFTNWKINIVANTGERITHHFNLEGKKVLISFDSSSVGDNIAWIPCVEEFRKKHKCEVYVSTFHNKLFESAYKNLNFIHPGSKVDGIYASYKIGVFLTNTGVDLLQNKSDYRYVPLQKVASDILGLDYKEIKTKIKSLPEYKADKPYICLGIHSTAQSKYWNNPTGWQELVDYVKSNGYDVYVLSKEENGYMGNTFPNGIIHIQNKTLEEIGSILQSAKLFVGIGSGLSWYSWALNVPTILISGFSEPYQEMETDVIRIINKDVCTGCFARHLFDRGDWNWCPDHKGTERQFECTKTITFDMIKPHVENLLKT